VSVITTQDLKAVFAVPPLSRKRDARRSLDLDAAECIARHIEAGGVTRYLYGGNAFLYHITSDEYDVLLGWLATFPSTRWAIPSLGPSFGRAIDQARLLRRHPFRCAMMLPCSDPRDAAGMEAGLREVANAAGVPLILYLKSEDGFGSARDPGLDAIGRLMDDGIGVAIKYAVVREDPNSDPYLDGLLRRVDRARVISGMGERPAVVHMRDYQLAGHAQSWQEAEQIRAKFIPLEDLRDAWGPARVLHHATELAGIASTGPIPPFVSPLTAAELTRLTPVARALAERST